MITAENKAYVEGFNDALNSMIQIAAIFPVKHSIQVITAAALRFDEETEGTINWYYNSGYLAGGQKAIRALQVFSVDRAVTLLRKAL
jgi:hypothetical protein